MGTNTSKDTRRISFDNTFALTTPIVIQKSIEAENAIAFENLPAVPAKESHHYKEQYSDIGEEGNGDYWSHRIDYLKKEHQQINKIIESEYDKKIEATSVNFESPKVIHDKMQKMKPCFDWRTKVHNPSKHIKMLRCLWKLMFSESRKKKDVRHSGTAAILKCYEDNHNQPLVCSPLVQAFTNCVTNCRLED